MKLNCRAATAPVLWGLVCALSALAQSPSIANVTNAAMPALDLPPGPVHLAPGSLATIWGSDLSDSAVSIAPPWQTVLGGTEVHLLVDLVYLGNANVPCSGDCELVADLVYVSPTQINFVVPDAQGLERSRVVLIRDGVRFDVFGAAWSDILNTGGLGPVYLDPVDGDFALFEVGYDCLFSFSMAEPSACGISWSQGQDRAVLGAVTDISGQLIWSRNPVHQGEIITLWATGLTGLSLDSQTGLLRQAQPRPVSFGVAQEGSDIPATVSYDSFDGLYLGQFSTPPAIWAGQSPQFVGLDQINIYFPVCATQAKATVEHRYDAFMVFGSIENLTYSRVYLPFLVSPGDPDCQSIWDATATTITSSANPSTTGQTVTFTAIVSPSTATGTVSFLDGSTTLGTASISGGQAALSTSGLAAGSHAISAVYGGDSNRRHCPVRCHAEQPFATWNRRNCRKSEHFRW